MADAICAIEGCGNPVYGQGHCANHYRKMKASGELPQLRNRTTHPPKRCTVDGCEKWVASRGLCPMHLMRLRTTGSVGSAQATRQPRQGTCSVDGCEKPVASTGLCTRHYSRKIRTGDPGPADLINVRRRSSCSIDGCDRRVAAKNLCEMHYRRWKNNGDPLVARPKAADGAGYVTAKGYRVTQVDGRPVGVHVLVMEKLIGRRLLPGESCHHKNGQRDDNRPENLELWSKAQPAGQRVADKVIFAREMLALYGSEEERHLFAAFSPLANSVASPRTSRDNAL